MKLNTLKIKRMLLRTITVSIMLITWILYLKIPVQASNKSDEKRIWGESRYETSIKISQECWKSGSEYAIIVSGEDYADALSAVPLAKAKNGSIILTEKTKLDGKSLEELKRLKVKHVLIIGGEGSVSKNVEDTIKSNVTSDVNRIWGKNRYETSVEVAEQLGNKVSGVFIVSGENYADALSSASIAAMKGIPIILTEKNNLSKEAMNYISNNDITRAYVIGGTASVSDEVKKLLPMAERIGGLDRYETNKKVIERFISSFDLHNSYIALGDGKTGLEFADALAGSALAAKMSAPIIITDKSLQTSTKELLEENLLPTSNIIVLGGSYNVPESIVKDINIPAKLLDKEGEVYSGSLDGNVDIIKDSVTLKGDVRGNLYIEGNNVLVSNITVKGVVYINPSKGGKITLDTVKADKIVVLSGSKDSISFKNVKSKFLDLQSKNIALISINNSTLIENTRIVSPSVLEVNSGSFGNIEINNTFRGDKVEFKGIFDKPVTVRSEADLNMVSGTTLYNVILDSDAIANNINLNGTGNLGNVYNKNNSAILELADNIYILGRVETLVKGTIISKNEKINDRIEQKSVNEFSPLYTPTTSSGGSSSVGDGSSTSPTTVVIVTGSVSGIIAGDKKISGLMEGKLYKVTIDPLGTSVEKYTDAAGNLVDAASKAALGVGKTEIIGLKNGTSYKVEEVDLSTATVGLEVVGDKTAGQAFNVSISGAKNTAGADLAGNVNITIVSNDGSTDVTVVDDGGITFTAGAATVPVTIGSAGTYMLRVTIAGVTGEKAVSNIKVAAKPVIGSLTLIPSDPLGSENDGRTKIAVTETADVGNEFVYKNFGSESVALPALDEVADGGWTLLPVDGIIVAADGDKIVVVERVQADKKAKKVGQTVAVATAEPVPVDKSTATVGLETAGDKTAGEAFNVSISGGKNIAGVDLTGSVNITIVSNDGIKDVTVVDNEGITFTAGAATVPVTIGSAGTYMLRVTIAGVTGEKVISNITVNTLVPTEVVLASGSAGTPGNSKIAGLSDRTKYRVEVDGTTKYVKSNGTLSDSEDDGGEILGTEITGLVNGKTYKVIPYVLNLYYVNDAYDKIKKVNFNSGIISNVVSETPYITWFDISNDKRIYYLSLGDMKIKSIKLDGTDSQEFEVVKDIHSEIDVNYTRGLAIDKATNYVYWAFSGDRKIIIYRKNILGGPAEWIYSVDNQGTGTGQKIQDIKISNGYLYYCTDYNNIVKLNLNGLEANKSNDSNIKEIKAPDTAPESFGINSLAVDSLDSKLYWLKHGEGIFQSDLNGMGINQLVIPSLTPNGEGEFHTIGLGGGTIYWSTYYDGKIYKNDGSGTPIVKEDVAESDFTILLNWEEN